MKILTSTILCLNLILFAAGFLTAQNWQPLNVQDKYNFRIDTNEYITNTLWIDSVETKGTDTIYFLNKIAASCSHCDTIEADEGTRFLELQGQFLGETMTKKPSGSYLFSGNETFILYPRAPLNFAWNYQVIGTDSLTARVAEVGIREVFGVMDSVKYIVFEELDTMLLSKNHGILSFPGLGGTYDLLGIEGRNLGEILPGIKEIYDFQVGDVFQYFTENFGFGRLEIIRKVKILAREDQDSSIVYQTNVISNIVDYPPLSAPVYSYGSYDEELTIDLTYDAPLKFLDETYPHQLHAVSDADEWFPPECSGPLNHPENIYLPFRIEKDPETGRITKSTEFPTILGSKKMYLFINDTSDILRTEFCVGYEVSEHQTGLGEVFKNAEILDNVVTTHLMGYVKGGDTTGIITPDIVLNVNESLEENSAVLIHPTLSDGQYSIKTIAGYSLQLAVYNPQGQLIRQISSQPSGQDIDLDLIPQPAGVYFVKVWLDQQFSHIKIVKI